MVILFETIPLHIQTQIASKINFFDFMKFELSSKHGRDVGKILKKPVTMDLGEIIIKDHDVVIHYHRRNGKFARFSLSEKTDGQKYPLFCSRTVLAGIMTNERGLEIVDNIEKGLITGKHVLCNLNINKMDAPVFSRFLEAINVEKIGCYELNPEFVKLPVMQKMKYIRLDSHIETKDILQLLAKELSVSSNSSNVGSELNMFFKQWFLNNRCISKFSLGFEEDNTGEVCENIFFELPRTLLWSADTHNTSIIGTLSLEELLQRCDTSMFDLDNKLYSLNNGTKTLFIVLHSNFICAAEVSDAQEHLLNLLEPVCYRKVTGVCHACNVNTCSCYKQFL